MPTVFSKIISGEIPSHLIKEDADFISFLDINPLVMGHTLVIPKQETDYIFDMKEDQYEGLWRFAKSVAAMIKSNVACERVGIAVIGLEVAHAHIHLIPLKSVEDINFSKPKLNPSEEELAEIAKKIRA